MTNTFSANQPALGYLYQIRYALFVLLQAIDVDPESSLSLERLDDVAFEADGEPLELIQLKHVRRATASLTDASKDLWKTLRIWSLQMRDRPVSASAPILSLITTGTASAGSAAAKLRAVDGRDEAGALRLLDEVAAGSRNEGNESAYAAFKALADDERRALLSRIRVVDDSPDIGDVRERMLRKIRVYSPHFEALYSRLEGWWFQRAIENLKDDSPASTIAGVDMIAQIRDLVSQLQDDNLPNDFPMAIYMDETELSERQRVFVTQLRLVLVSDSRLRLAIGHYYRAFEQRSRWLDEGLLFPSEIDAYEHYLEGEWRTQFEIMREDLGELPSDEEMQQLGRRLFGWADTAQSRPIRPRFMDAGFSRGSYHILANDLRIGWHAEFERRIAALMVQATRSPS